MIKDLLFVPVGVIKYVLLLLTLQWARVAELTRREGFYESYTPDKIERMLERGDDIVATGCPFGRYHKDDERPSSNNVEIARGLAVVLGLRLQQLAYVQEEISIALTDLGYEEPVNVLRPESKFAWVKSDFFLDEFIKKYKDVRSSIKVIVVGYRFHAYRCALILRKLGFRHVRVAVISRENDQCDPRSSQWWTTINSVYDIWEYVSRASLLGQGKI